jgi:hypothetical protein
MPSITVEQINAAMPPVPTVGTPPAGVPRRDLTNQALQALRSDVADLEEGKLDASAAVVLGAPLDFVLPTDEVVVTRGGVPAPVSLTNLLATRRFKRLIFDDGADGTAALQAAATATADFPGETTIAVSGHGIIVTATIVWPVGKMAILVGDGERVTTYDWRGTGPMLQPSGNYHFQGFQISGGFGSPVGKTGIGNNGTEGASGMAVARDLRFDQLDYGIDFNGGWEHPIGLDYQNIYVQAFRIAGINIGSTDAASSGESNFEFDNINVNQLFGTPAVSTTTVTVDTPSTSFDRVTWTAPIPRYGFLLIRSANGTSDWRIVPNQRLPITTGTSFDAAKAPGETWVYRLQAHTVGVAVFRAKSVNFGALQVEYSAVGLLLQDVTNSSIGTLYAESRSASTTRCGLAQIMLVRSHAHAQSAWCENITYQCVNVDSSFEIETLRNANTDGSMRALAMHRTNLSTGQCRTEYGFIRHSGTVVPTYSYDGTSHIERGTANYSQVTGLSRPRFPSRNGGAVRSASIANNTLANVLTFDVPPNAASTLLFAFDARTAPSFVSRIAATGMLTVAAVSASGTVVATAVVSGAANAVQSGTLTAAPVFSTTVSGSTVTVRFIADSTHSAAWNLTLTPIAQTGSADNISVLTV